MTLLLLLGLPAYAFRPDPAFPQGLEPVRVREYHKQVQYELRHDAGWTDFVRGEGEGWQARFDERTGLPYRAWGPGIAMGPLSDEASAGAALLDLLARNPGLVGGLDLDGLVLERAGYVAATDTWYIRLNQRVPDAQGLSGQADVPVWRGAVEARVRFGKLILLGISVLPQAEHAALAPVISAERALQTAIDAGPAASVTHTNPSTSLVLLPLDDGHDLGIHLAWEVRTRTAWPPGQWVSYVDANTGALLNWHNEVRFLSGTISGTHDTRTVDGDTTTSVLPYAEITGASGATTNADIDGAWSLADETSATAELRGTYVKVRNNDGSNGELTLTGDGTFTDVEASQAEIDSYVFLEQVRAWGMSYASDLSYINADRLTSNVNQNSACNAYYDGNVNFFQSGSGCNNTGRIADVNYHEWGHGFHYYNLETGVYDSSISEGIGDCVAALNTGDSTIGPYFYTTGGGIRELETDYVYPDDWVGESHQDGLIFAGAVWDLWGELDNTYAGDADTAYDVLNNIFVNGLKAGPEIPDSYDEFVAADDDDGDLSNGTPHQCEIITAFGYHGLGPSGGSTLVSLSHTPVENQPASATEYPVEGELTNLAPTCVDFTVTSAKAIYSVDGGSSWSEAELDTDGESVWGGIPAVADGSIVTYYLELEASDGSVVTAPTGGTINPFTFLVGDFEEIYCEDFEDDDGGYTHELVSGSDELGADDWIWGKPRGSGGDPDYAYSGDRVWGNDLGGGNYNGEYQDNKHNRLISPAIDVAGYGRLVLQYRRWLNVEDGVYDVASISANEAEVWTNHATSEDIGDEHHQDDQWALHTVELPVDGSGSLALWWDIDSDRGLTFGGWTLDDVCVYARVDSATVDTGGDSAEPDGDDTGTPNTDPLPDGDSGDAADDTEDLDLKTGGCGSCSTGAGAAPGALGVIAMAGLVLRRRRRG